MIPRLIHPIHVEITQIDPVATPAVHAQFREPRGKPVYKTPIRLVAQLGSPRSTDAYQQRPFGDNPSSDGHLLLRVVDCTRAGYTPQKGDRITKVYAGDAQEGDVKGDQWTVVQIDPAGHYGGKHHFWVLFYRDQQTLASVA